MTEQHLLLLKEKIIKTDAVISLLTEKNSKQNQLQKKLQFLFKKFVEKSKEAETLHQKVCICIADHEPLKTRVVELETQYSELEIKHNKFVNSSELKFQIINKELETLKEKNGQLIKMKEGMEGQLSTKTTKRNKRKSIQEDEIDLLKTENELLNTQVEKLAEHCNKESKEIERLTLLLTNSDTHIQVDTHLVETAQLKEKISKLESTEERLRNKVNVLRKEQEKLGDQLAELRLEKNLLRESNLDLEKQLNQKLYERCNKNNKKSMDTEKLNLPFIETDALNTNIVQVNTELSSLKDTISKLDITKEQLKNEIKVLKKERQQLDNQLAELHLEKKLLKKSSMDCEEQLNQGLYENCDTSDGNSLERLSLPFMEGEVSNKNDFHVARHQKEASQVKEKLPNSSTIEKQLNRLNERLEKNTLEKSNVGLEKETVGFELTEMDLFGAEEFEDTSDAESVTNLLREMIDLPLTLLPFRDDSCSEVEDCLGFLPTAYKNCRTCSSMSIAPTKILEIDDHQKTSSRFLQCWAASGDFNVTSFNAVNNQICPYINSAKKHVENVNTAQSENKCKMINYRLQKRKAQNRKPIIKRKQFKTDDSGLIKRLKLAITQDMLMYMDKYFQKNLKSLKKFNDRYRGKLKSTQFWRNKKLIRQKVEKLREIKSIDSSESENESPLVKRKKFRSSYKNISVTGKFSQIKSVNNEENAKSINASEDYIDISNKVIPNHNQKKNNETQKQRHLNHSDISCTVTKPKHKKSSGHDLNVLTKQNNVYSEKAAEFEVISQDSGYARSEADSLELELQNHEKFFAKSADINNDISELQPNKSCERKADDNKNTHNLRSCKILERKRKCNADKNVKKLVNSKTLECTVSINSSRSPNLVKSINKETSKKFDKIKSNATATCDLHENSNGSNDQNKSPRKVETSLNCSKSSEKIDSPDSPEPEINSFTLPSMNVSPIKRSSIYDQVQISSNSTSTKANTNSLEAIRREQPETPRDFALIDSPASPEPELHYETFTSSPVNGSVLKKTTIYDQVQIKPSLISNKANENSFKVVHAEQARDVQISFDGIRIPENTLASLKDHIANIDGKPKTTCATFKRPNCAKRIKQTRVLPSKPPVIATVVLVKKVPKLKAAQARKLFKKLLNFGNESTIVDQVASKFTGQNKEYVASLVLSEVCLYTSQKVETKYTPPAPPLTQAQRLLLGFMYRLDTSCMSGLLETFLSAAEKELLVETNLAQLQQITRLYCGVCKFKKDLDRMRRTVCDAFYFMGDFIVPFFFTVLSTWIEVLPLQIDSTDDLLIKVLIQVLNLKTCKTPGYNLFPLKNLLKVHYNYPTERWNSDEVFQEVFNAYLGNPTKSNEYAILILCKNHPMKWVLQQINTHIKSVLINSESVDLKTKITTMITHMVSEFPSKEAEINSKKPEVTNLKTWLGLCLEGDVPRELEDSIRKCINML